MHEINANVKLNLDIVLSDETIAFVERLDRIVSVLSSAAPVQDVQETEEVSDTQLETVIPVRDSTPPEEADEPAELSVSVPEAIAEPEKPYGHIVYAGHIPHEEWKAVPRSRCLQWIEKDGKLVIKYRNEIVRPSWNLMKKLSGMRQQERSAEIHRIMRREGHETNNRFSAYNVFATCLQHGEISIPDVQEKKPIEEDPDAAFRPFVTPFISTQPDPNSGKVEGTLEG